MHNLVWICDKETSWEVDWIEYLFKDVKLSGPVLVYNSSVDIKSYLEKYDKVFGLIHLSDEWDRDSVEHYSQVKIVLRNYYKDINSNVLSFPLGWMRTFPYNIKPKSIQERKLIWSFSGHIDKTTRPEMVKWISTITPGKGYFKRCGENWGSFDGHALNPTQLAELYNDSYFVPCPRGNHSIDSLRVCEALQAGAIPIVERDAYWQKLYGNNMPLLEIDHWNQSPELIYTLIKDLDKLEELRNNIYTWWIAYCTNLKKTIKEKYENC